MLVSSKRLGERVVDGLVRKYPSAGFALMVTAAGGVRFEVYCNDGILAGDVAPHALMTESYEPLLGETLLAPIRIFDGRWHHISASYKEGTVGIYVDGHEMFVGPPSLKPDHTLAESLSIGSDGFDTSPDGRLHAAATRAALFGGHIEEVRLWHRPQAAAQVLARANTRLSGSEVDLLGYWSLRELRTDPQAPGGQVCPNEAASSVLSSGRLLGVRFDQYTEYLPMAGRPYFVVHSALHQDFQQVTGDGREAAEYSTFRTSISVLEADGKPHPCTLHVSALSNDKVGSSAASMHDIGPQLPALSVDTDGLGYVPLVSKTYDRLYAPVLLVHADFMGPSERLFIYRDEALLSRLENVDGDSLRQDTSQRQGLLRDSSPEQAELVASAIRSVMKKSSRFRFSNAQGPAPGAAAMAPLSAPASHGEALWSEERLSCFAPGCDLATAEMGVAPDSQAAGERIFCVCEPAAPPSAAGVASATLMPGESVESFHLRSRDGGRLTTANIESGTLALAREDLGARIARGRIVNLSAPTSVAVAGLFDLWTAFLNGVKQAADIVIRVVQRVVEDVAQGVVRIVREITAVVEFIGNEIATFVISTIEKAVELVRGLFVQIGVAANQAVKFFRELFDWQDIQQTKRLIKASFLITIKRAKTDLQTLRTQSQQLFAQAKNNLSQAFDRVIALVGEQRFIGDVPRRQPARLGVTGRWALDTVLEHGDRSRPVETNASTAGTEGSEIERLAKRVLDAVTDPAVRRSFSDALETLQQSIRNLRDAPLQVIKAFLQALKGLSLLIVNLVDVAADAMFTLCIYLLGVIEDLLKQAIEVPILSWVYKTYISNGDELTMLDLSALLIAIPATALDKLTRGTDTSLFAPAQAERIEARLPRWMAGQAAPAVAAADSAAADTEQKDLRLYRYHLSLVYQISLVLDAICEPFVDMLDVSSDAAASATYAEELIRRHVPRLEQAYALFGLGALLLAPQIGIVIGGLPLNLDENGRRLPELVHDKVAWHLQVCRTVFDYAVLAFEAFKATSDVPKYIATGLAAVHAMVIVASVAVDLVAADGESDASTSALFKFGMNMFGVVPGLCKVLGTQKAAKATDYISFAVLMVVDFAANMFASFLAAKFVIDNHRSLPTASLAAKPARVHPSAFSHPAAPSHHVAPPYPAAMQHLAHSTSPPGLSKSHIAATKDGTDLLLYFEPLQVVVHYHREPDGRFKRRSLTPVAGCTGVALGKLPDGLVGMCTTGESRPGLGDSQTLLLGLGEDGRLRNTGGLQEPGDAFAPAIDPTASLGFCIRRSGNGETCIVTYALSPFRRGSTTPVVPEFQGLAIAFSRGLPGSGAAEDFAMVVVAAGRVSRYSVALQGSEDPSAPRLSLTRSERPSLVPETAKSSNPALCLPYVEVALAAGGIAHFELPPQALSPQEPAVPHRELYALDLPRHAGIATYNGPRGIETVVATGQGFKCYSQILKPPPRG